MSSNKNPIGENIRKFRKLKKISQVELANMIKADSGSISHIENGSRNPSFEMAENIAEALGVTLKDLVNVNEPESNYDIVSNDRSVDSLVEEFPEGIRVLRRASKKLSPEAKRKMIKLMEAFMEEDE